MKGRHAWVSCSVGVRLPGGRHGTTLAIYTLPPIEADGGKHPIQQLPGPADERAADPIFVATRGLADKHQARARDAIRKHELGRGSFQCAAVELRHSGPQRLEIGRPFSQRASRNLRCFRRFAAAARAPGGPVSGAVGAGSRAAASAATGRAAPALSAKRSCGVSSIAASTPARTHHLSVSAAWIGSGGGRRKSLVDDKKVHPAPMLGARAKANYHDRLRTASSARIMGAGRQAKHHPGANGLPACEGDNG